MKVQFLAGAQIRKGDPLLYTDNGAAVPVLDLDNLDNLPVIGYAADDVDMGDIVEVFTVGIRFLDPSTDTFLVLERQ